MASETLEAALVSLIMKPVAVPALVREREVGVVKPEAKVNAKSRASVVTIVLPAS